MPTHARLGSARQLVNSVPAKDAAAAAAAPDMDPIQQEFGPQGLPCVLSIPHDMQVPLALSVPYLRPAGETLPLLDTPDLQAAARDALRAPSDTLARIVASALKAAGEPLLYVRWAVATTAAACGPAHRAVVVRVRVGVGARACARVLMWVLGVNVVGFHVVGPLRALSHRPPSANW